MPHRRQLVIWSCICCGSAVWVGCAKTGATQGDARDPERPEIKVVKPVSTDEDGVAPETVAMAQQIERDVAEFMRRQKESNDTATTEAPPRKTGRSRIEWNAPAERTQAQARPDDQATKFPDAQPPLASDAEEAVLPTTDTVASQDLNELIVALSRELYQDATYADMPLRQLLLIASLTMTDPDRSLNPEAIPGLTAKEREILGHFQVFFTALGTDLEAGDHEVDLIVQRAVDGLRSNLIEQPRLELAASKLCTRVGGFGDFNEFKKDPDNGVYRFLAQRDQQAIVYLEVDRFTSEQNKQGQWVTELSQQLVIYSDRDGIPVWKKSWEPAVDRSHNRRKDFFTVQIITLPKALGVGKYHLKILCRDEKSGAETESAITFEMVADPSLAVSSR